MREPQPDEVRALMGGGGLLVAVSLSVLYALNAPASHAPGEWFGVAGWIGFALLAVLLALFSEVEDSAELEEEWEDDA